MSRIFGISEAKAKEPEVDAITYASGSEMDKAIAAIKRAAPEAFERFLSRKNLLEPSRKIPRAKKHKFVGKKAKKMYLFPYESRSIPQTICWEKRHLKCMIGLLMVL